MRGFWAGAGIVGSAALVSGGVALARHSPTRRVAANLPPVVTAVSTSTTTTTTATTATAPSAPAAPTDVSGTVRDSGGRPVAGAYVIGVDSLTVVRTDSSGRYSMSCELTSNGMVGRRMEPLVASRWLLPVEPTGRGGYAFGEDTTRYGPPPTAPGLGYAFSGGAADVDHAEPATCDGRPVDFVLGPGGGADIQILDASGNPVSTSNMAPDNLYLPGLGRHAALETAPAADGHQRVEQLAAGVLRIDGTTSTLHCSGQGVVDDAAAAGADVTIVPGKTATVTCRQSR